MKEVYEMTKEEIIIVLQDIYKFCSAIPNCYKCMFANDNNSDCNLRGVPWKWEIEDIKKENGVK